ncbi:MAG: MupA/Atu3671 family FMN-dependent luciferase-like monooxygenase, partial [Pseudomonadota bacterium]
MGFSCLLQGADTLTIQCGAMVMEAGHAVSAVITRDARVRDWATDAGIPVFTSGKDYNGQVDWLLSIANVDVIPDSVLAKATQGAVNFHDGPLPRYAGLNAPVWALMNGEATHGITWHVIEDGIDEGRIVAQQMFDISEDDTALTLNAKCFSAAIECFSDVLAALANGLNTATAQDLTGRSYFGLHDRPFAGGALDFDAHASDIVRMVRALYHGDYRNPLSVPKLVLGDRMVLTREAALADGQGEPGTVLSADTTSVTIAAAEGAVRLSGLTDPMGAPVSAGLAPGAVVPSADLAAIDTALKETAKGDRTAFARFATYRPAQWCDTRRQAGTVEIALQGNPDHLAFAFAANVAALAGEAHVDLAVASPTSVAGAHLGWHPIRIDAGETLGAARAAFDAELTGDDHRIAADLPARVPDIDHRSVPDAALSTTHPMPGAALTLALGTAMLHADLSRISEDEARLIGARVDHLADRLGNLPGDTAVAALPLLPQAERDMLLTDWNATETEFATSLCIHQHFEAQVDKTPDAPAVAYRGETLSYAQLDARANQLAHVLREMGVGPNTPVGLHVQRSVELLIGALGILKAGGAYLPLDPAYPADRIELYIEDSGSKVIVGETAMPLETAATTINIDADPRLGAAPETRLEATADAEDLAYMIYTSGSTGRPKGVMIEHRNVSNFFTGMDARVPHEDGSVLMAVTSLSFDISVLELFWTLARGFKVVVSDEEKMVAGAAATGSAKPMDFSLYYWGNDDGVGQDKYTMLLEGAKFGDKNGFCAVWTPERHFHAFGGLYPNPAVTGAAVAAVTENIGVRAGSCVAPLHHPARIAEEWAVIDNLTGGRAGIAFASGWQPDDFVLRPENSPPNNKPALFDALEDVRKLWVGEEVEFAKADGTKVARLTQPRPVSQKLNAWVTTAGNPDTWRQAGESGCHVLTHLLGQS